METKIERVPYRHNIRKVTGDMGEVYFDVRHFLLQTSKAIHGGDVTVLMEKMAVAMYDMISGQIKSKPKEDDGLHDESEIK